MAENRVLRCVKQFFGANEAAQILKVSVTLTDAQIKALPTTPFSVVAAPGSGVVVHLVQMACSLNTAAGAYTNVNAVYSDFHVVYAGQTDWLVPVFWNDNTGAPAFDFMTNTFGGTTPVWWAVGPWGNIFNGGGGATYGKTTFDFAFPAPLAKTTVDNKAVHIAIDNNGSGNLTGGNAANTLKVTSYYLFESL